jgi:hypothetical protein
VLLKKKKMILDYFEPKKKVILDHFEPKKSKKKKKIIKIPTKNFWSGGQVTNG